MRSHGAALIAKKRDGAELTRAEIEDLVGGITDGSVGDVQLGAFLMAVCWRGMSQAETTALTLAMRDSGRVLDLSAIPGPKVDKHSTGGVGDKVSLVLAPLVAACGVHVPMISGRGLGHTGGTIDKLESIPGYRTRLDAYEFAAVLAECGYVMAGASDEIAPADRRMYAARDVSATVASVPLITSSILSKKLAEGIDALVMDVKCGHAAFLRERAQAQALMESLVATAQAASIRVRAVLTAMDVPLGRAAGNALEVLEAVECLRGRGPSDLMEVTLALGAEMLALAGKADGEGDARRMLREALASGVALQRFIANVRRQGGDASFVEEPRLLPRAPVLREVTSPRAGFVADVDALVIGQTVCELGGGRRQPEDAVDPRVGVVLERTIGERVEKGGAIATIHARSEAEADAVAARVAQAFVVGDAPVSRGPLVLARR